MTEMWMKKAKYALALAGATLVLAGLSYAKSYKIDVIYPATVGGITHLRPGTYHVQLLSNAHATRLAFISRNGQRLASVPVTVKNESRKNEYTEVDYNKLSQNDHAITEIRFRGQREALVLASSGKRMASGAKTSSAMNDKSKS